MILLEKIKQKFEKELGISSVIEPSKAGSTKEVRLLFVNKELFKCAPDNQNVGYTPYQFFFNLLLSVRLNGANTNNFITSKSLKYSILLEELLREKSLIFKDIGEEIRLDEIKNSPKSYFHLVGDAQLMRAQKKQENVSYGANDNGNDALFVWRKDWELSIKCIGHRHFFNPKLKSSTFKNNLVDDLEVTKK